ncbi:hypothetical protein [Endozoicomonas sp. 8E]|uniref:hypothetical protein n=1 Tax=Endozoicomonas sp. 8E TaxID=3035692 RepID=UPI002939251F|nr:hypothetical protein [Endozoicomonas sp. 8E]WOG29011.1 hypothetical protein P6910_04930 [Endozoicomonas sp. 8E]
MTRPFIVEPEEDADSPKQNVSKKRDMHTLPGNSSGIAATIGYAGSDSPPDGKRHKPDGYGVKTNIIALFSWQLLHASDLPVAYEMILTTRDAPLSYDLHSWLRLGWVIAVGWLLNSYWYPDLPLSNPIEQQASQELPIAIITMVFGSGHNPPKYPLSKSYGQQTSQATTQRSGSLYNFLNSGSGEGHRGPHRRLHTLSLNCFFYPCHGVCRFRPTSNSEAPAEWLLNSSENSCPHLANGRCISCTGRFEPVHPEYSREGSLLKKLNDLSGTQRLFDSGQFFQPQADDIDGSSLGGALNGVASDDFDLDEFDSDGATPSIMSAVTANKDDATAPLNDDVTMFDNFTFTIADFEGINGALDPNSPPEEGEISFPLTQTNTVQVPVAPENVIFRATHCQQAESDHKSNDHNRQEICCEMVVRQNGRQKVCGKTCNDVQALLDHKKEAHRGEKICNEMLVGVGGQRQACGKVYKDSRAMSEHKRRSHSKQKTCEVDVFAEDGQLRPCGMVCKSAKALSDHKGREHGKHQTCDETTTGVDGELLRCGTVCKNPRALSDHKRRKHTGQQRCDETVVTDDGLQRPCGKVSKNVQALMEHKRNNHSGQQTCDVSVIREGGHRVLCGRVCRNILTLKSHKKIAHTGQRTCDKTVITEDGQQHPCGKVCSNALALSTHKSNYHTGQKTCGHPVLGNDGQLQPCGKVCRNARSLSEHKRKDHTGQKICDAIMVGKDGQRRLCGRVFENTQNLSQHKIRSHTSEKICDVIVVGDSGQQRPCGKVCMNTGVLYNHKRNHRKLKPVNLGLNGDLSP